MRLGYKQTEVGEIPSDWDLVPFSEFVDFQNGINAGKEAYGKGFRFANVLEIITNSHLNAESIPGRIQISDSAAKRYALEPGDFLFNRTSEIPEEVGLASVYMGTEHVVFGGFVIRGRPRDLRLRHVYAGYGLRSPLVRRQIISKGQGAIRSNIGQADLRHVFVLIPKCSEQEAIAGALSDADALIESLEALIAKKRQIKQGAMQELLTGKTRLPGFTGEWNERKLGTLGSFIKGRGVSKSEALSGDLPCVRYGELYTRHEDIIRDFQSRISVEVAKSAMRLKKGDILFAGSGETKEEIGKCAALTHEVEAYAGGDIVILRTSEGDPAFLGYYLNTPPINRQKASRGQGDAVVHISARALEDIDTRIPSEPEQSAIASVLSDMDAEIAALETKLQKALQIKQGMMQELLTGRIRLV